MLIRGWPLPKRLLLLIAPLLAIVVALLVLVGASMEIMSAGRAYVGGEGLWSKAQKDAVHHLLRYARTLDEADYRRYVSAIAVPLGDRKAREALDRPLPDYAAAHEGFIEGRNHPEDVDAMSRLFVRFRHVGPVSKAIGIWAEADVQIASLRDVADRLQAEISGPRDPARIESLLEEILRVNAALAPLEDEFSYTLGEATRWMRDLLFLVMLVAAVLLVGAAALAFRALLRRTDAAEAALRESDERLQLVADSVPALIAYVDREQRFRFSNRTHEQWFDIAHELWEGRSMLEVFGEESFARMRPHVEHVLVGKRVEFEFSLGEGDGARTLQVTYRPHFDARGAVLGFYVLASDVTAIRRAEEQERRAGQELAKVAERLEFLAHHDALTALPNRFMLQKEVRRAISLARRHGRGLALLYVDLDRFKDVNDSLGHGVGDGLLRAVSERMMKTVRNEDLVARLGGDEFCILLQDIGEPREAGVVAQKLVAELSEPYRVSDHDLYIAASIGIACMPQDGYDMETLLKNADNAMYRAKDAGRGNFQFFSLDANRGAMSAVALASSLRRALANNEFVLHYEPRVDTRLGRVVALEALLRWQHPERGLLLPAHFLRFAEESGLIVPIGAWVLREACAQARRWSDIGCPVAVSVNLSMRQLRNQSLPAQVRAAIEGNGLPPNRLELEVTESMAMQAPEVAERSLRTLSELGARISLDDFGTGHSALHYLKRFQIDVLKIDQAFIGGLPGDRYDAAIVRSVAELAGRLDLDVVAEGVRTREQRDFLLESGCSLCQGELFGPSRPARDIGREFLMRQDPSEQHEVVARVQS